MTVLLNEQIAISGHIIPSKKLSEWQSVIEEWTLLIDRYCRITKDDVPYWYTERANIGVLAGACWRAGYIALEEFQFEKGYHYKPKWSGRADLWWESENYCTLVEAKYKCVSLNSLDIEKTLREIFAEACADAKKSKGSQIDLSALGMVFVPVYIPNSASPKKINERIEAMTIEIKNAFQGCMIFWHFPSAARELLGVTEKNYWPGLFVISREV